MANYQATVNITNNTGGNARIFLFHNNTKNGTQKGSWTATPNQTVDHTLYDHSSVLKTLEELFGLNPLTKRDAAAKSVLKTLSLKKPRTDCPISLNSPAPLLLATKPRMTAEERALLDAQPVPVSGNLVNALYTLRKAEIELSGRTPPEIAAIHARFETIRTRGDAEAYAVSVLEKVNIAREQRKLALQQRKP